MRALLPLSFKEYTTSMQASFRPFLPIYLLVRDLKHSRDPPRKCPSPRDFSQSLLEKIKTHFLVPDYVKTRNLCVYVLRDAMLRTASQQVIVCPEGARFEPPTPKIDRTANH